MNHFCTAMDRGYLVQGLAFWRSLAAHDPAATLWVLALDEFAADLLREMADPRLFVVSLEEVEAGDTGLGVAKGNRSLMEYYFTLKSCWPGWLLARQPQIDRLTEIDSDMLIFTSPAVIFEAMDAARASVLVTAHGFPGVLRHYEQHGIYNAGLISFRRDKVGLACLDDWRKRCLAWCHDRVEGGRFAEQRYLVDWASDFGSAVTVLSHPGVNLAPWNWAAHDVETGPAGAVRVDGQPLVLFHFARFRPICGTWWWQSGQLDYGVMPYRMRTAIYGPYWHALRAARKELLLRRPELTQLKRKSRLGPNFWRDLVLRVIFGSDWLRIGGRFFSGRLGLGRFSGRGLAWLRRMIRRNPAETRA